MAHGKTTALALLAIYLGVLAFLAFGSHSVEINETLKQVGLKQDEFKTEKGIQRCIYIPRSNAPCPPASQRQYEETIPGVGPNSVGFVAYAAVGVVGALWWDRRQGSTRIGDVVAKRTSDGDIPTLHAKVAKPNEFFSHEGHEWKRDEENRLYWWDEKSEEWIRYLPPPGRAPE